MKTIFLAILLACEMISCTPTNTPNAQKLNPGLAQGIIGGKTEIQSRQSGLLEKKRFDAISNRMVMVMLEEVNPNGNTVLMTASGVILSESFIITSAHIFKGFKFDTSHIGVLFFGASGTWQDRPRMEFSKSDILNKTSREVDEMATPDWAKQAGHKDYVLIRINDGLPAGFQNIRMINDIGFFKQGDPYRVAGFGQSEAVKLDYQLRTLDLTLSRSNLNQVSSKFPFPINLGVETEKFFLELNANAANTWRGGDSGGAVYYEHTNASGNIEVYLAGIITSHYDYGSSADCANHLSSCAVAGYALRADAFYDDAMATARRIANGQR